MTDAINYHFKAKGAKVISSKPPFRSGNGTPTYASYAQHVAFQTSMAYVDHFKFLLPRYLQLGASSVNALFPQDNIHTNSIGADVATQALIRGALCGSGNPFAPFVKNTNVQPSECALFSP
ncbi:hypothetical protein FS837_002160 [Tulasnella sp. UAMH 9824]|nr:hypothetical protein FS837_002160 [Tulasnella sp. UAMH 9824]